jgi:hypothetical protein
MTIAISVQFSEIPYDVIPYERAPVNAQEYSDHHLIIPAGIGGLEAGIWISDCGLNLKMEDEDDLPPEPIAFWVSYVSLISGCSLHPVISSWPSEYMRLSCLTIGEQVPKFVWYRISSPTVLNSFACS